MQWSTRMAMSDVVCNEGTPEACERRSTMPGGVLAPGAEEFDTVSHLGGRSERHDLEHAIASVHLPSNAETSEPLAVVPGKSAPVGHHLLLQAISASTRSRFAW